MLKLFALITYTLFLLTSAFAQTPYYQGKTITIIHGRDPGGTGDMRVRAMIPFLQKYIPGNPNIVNEYMPGGGGRFGRATEPGLARRRIGGLSRDLGNPQGRQTSPVQAAS